MQSARNIFDPDDPPGNGEDTDTLLESADHALHQAEREGRDRVVAAL